MTDEGLAQAHERLERALAQLDLDGAPWTTQLGPETELLRALTPNADAGVSFAAPGGDSDPGGNAARARELLDRLLAELRVAASIQTKAEGRVIASTRIGLGGDTTCIVSASATARQLERHRARVDREQRARVARTRIVTSAFAAAGKIAIAAGTGNPLLALPAAWRFIESAMNEWEQATGAA